LHKTFESLRLGSSRWWRRAALGLHRHTPIRRNGQRHSLRQLLGLCKQRRNQEHGQSPALQQHRNSNRAPFYFSLARIFRWITIHQASVERARAWLCLRSPFAGHHSPPQHLCKVCEDFLPRRLLHFAWQLPARRSQGCEARVLILLDTAAAAQFPFFLCSLSDGLNVRMETNAAPSGFALDPAPFITGLFCAKCGLL
jgi:hypothetical protein